eukprot:CAMPEP_0197913310 /NCGR_PEP_ID=MMETSP1439-20131203/76451_1 /TAXON_ID=66791 /ORGANISM="Gonyaulax spinifera, Strain CCMP409" /LENGTH=589 /DNA_ID=CAMNT_0043535163 /DNA_START=82 /DNA_END=1851 /DNA_ORIENTATION=-
MPKKYDRRSCCLQASPCAGRSALPAELWTNLFDSLDKAFFPAGHPDVHMEGHCKCNKLQFRVDGTLTAAFICHCSMCRWYLAQANPSHTLWIEPATALTVTEGHEHLKQWTVERLSRNLRGQATVYFCGSCGTNINVRFSDPGAKMTLMWPWNFKFEEWGGTPPRHGYAEIFCPRFHAHYENRSVDAEDSLPKLADIWLEGMAVTNNTGDTIGSVSFPMPTAYYSQVSSNAAADAMFGVSVRRASPEQLQGAWDATRALLQEALTGGLVVLDGGTGTEVQRIAGTQSMDNRGWTCNQVQDFGDVVEQVHCQYCSAGAQCIMANTYATSRHVLERAGIGSQVESINAKALDLVRSAIAKQPQAVKPLVGASLSCHRGGDENAFGVWPESDYLQRSFNEQASILVQSGAEAIFLEMVFCQSLAMYPWRAAVQTGLPVFICLGDVRLDESGGPYMWWSPSDPSSVSSSDRKRIPVAEGLKPLLEHPSVVGVFVHHTSIADTGPALKAVREAGWKGPLGAYPDQGEHVWPNWTFQDIPVENFIAAAQLWLDECDCRMVGGCCGLGPQYIKALHEWKHSEAWRHGGTRHGSSKL